MDISSALGTVHPSKRGIEGKRKEAKLMWRVGGAGCKKGEGRDRTDGRKAKKTRAAPR